MPRADGSGYLTRRTMWESNPVFSPDGMHVAYLYSNGDPEVRLTRLYLTTLGGRDTVLSKALDRPIGDFVWSADSRSLIATAPDRTTNSLYRISLRGGVRRLDVGNVVPGVPLKTRPAARRRPRCATRSPRTVRSSFSRRQPRSRSNSFATRRQTAPSRSLSSTRQ